MRGEERVNSVAVSSETGLPQRLDSEHYSTANCGVAVLASMVGQRRTVA